MTGAQESHPKTLSKQPHDREAFAEAPTKAGSARMDALRQELGL